MASLLAIYGENEVMKNAMQMVIVTILVTSRHTGTILAQSGEKFCSLVWLHCKLDIKINSVAIILLGVVCSCSCNIRIVVLALELYVTWDSAIVQSLMIDFELGQLKSSERIAAVSCKYNNTWVTY